MARYSVRVYKGKRETNGACVCACGQTGGENALIGTDLLFMQVVCALSVTAIIIFIREKKDETKSRQAN